MMNPVILLEAPLGALQICISPGVASKRKRLVENSGQGGTRQASFSPAMYSSVTLMVGFCGPDF